MWPDYGYDSKRPKGTEEDLGKDVGEPQQRVRIVISGTWHVVILSLRLELFRMHFQQVTNVRVSDQTVEFAIGCKNMV